MDIEQKREYAKSLGIKQTHNMKSDTLDKKIALLNVEKVQSINTDEDKNNYLKRSGFDFNRLEITAKEMGIDKLTYRSRKKAFEGYVNGKTVDFLSVGMFN